MDERSLEDRVTALERGLAEQAGWHRDHAAWHVQTRARSLPAFEYRDDEPIANLLKVAFAGGLSLGWLLIRCAAIYAVGYLIFH
ncbi:MAG TPA: hypothetical protein VH560_12280 [Polyangia bacterium]|jgi:hypothetical protein|nr:hypothetical protein [Polyangia bacterium]